MDEDLHETIGNLASSREKSIAQTHVETADLFAAEAKRLQDLGFEDAFELGEAQAEQKRWERSARLWARKAQALAASADEVNTAKIAGKG